MHHAAAPFLGPIRCSLLQCALVEMSPLTGRKHQLRIHAAKALGTPILVNASDCTDRDPSSHVPIRATRCTRRLCRFRCQPCGA